MTSEHPFAQFIRIIGKGPHLSRTLTREETKAAFTLIMAGNVEPVQLGAFLCLLRVRTEEPEEAAGFIDAVKETFTLPTPLPAVDLDWPTYAGKKRQLPWYLLSALLLAHNGIRVFMHGADGHTPDRLYAKQVLESWGIDPVKSFSDAATVLHKTNFAFMSLDHLSPRLSEIMALKSLLGLRSPINTFARMLNPFNAPFGIQGIFHPGYKDVHREGAHMVGQEHLCVFKGEGGEAERRPNKPVAVQSLHCGTMSEEEWPPILGGEGAGHDEIMDVPRLTALWQGELDDAYGSAAVIGTAAIALRLMNKAASIDDAQNTAAAFWRDRDKTRLIPQAGQGANQ